MTVHHGDCLDVLRTMPDNSVDSIVTDPPYGLSFMGKRWDYDVPGVEIWAECLRVLKPGGHLLSFAGTRTHHRMAVRIEDAGFQIRDMVAWVYGSGFPKSLDVSKAIDKAAGAEREVVGKDTKARSTTGASALPTIGGETVYKTWDITAPATDEAKQWEGWGTALKPAFEPITLARKPFAGTVAQNVLEYGAGALNIDGCRVAAEPWKRPGSNAIGGIYGDFKHDAPRSNDMGRWPANLIHDGSDEVVGLFPQTTSGGGDKHGRKPSTFCASTDWQAFKGTSNGGDTGSAARFFYCAKASKADRGADNRHPTVKPADLMRYLCRLITPPGGIVLDPFAGSGSTGKAAALEGFGFIGIEREAEYVEIARARIEAECTQVGILA